METIFNVQNEDLQRLSPKEAVSFFRDLIWAEARKNKIPISKIHVSLLINIPDGGIDAVIEESSLENSDLIKPGQTAYQIKAGASFKPRQDSEIRKALFKNSIPCRDNLADGIRHCLDNNGTYILVCFGSDLVDPEHRNAVEIIADYLKECGYQNPKTEVWSLTTFKLLTHHSLFQFDSQKARGQRDEYDWTEIGKKFIQLYPNKSLEIAEVMLEHFGEDDSIFGDLFSQTHEVINAILLNKPGEIWKMVAKYIGPPIDSRAYHITQWLRGGEHYELKEGAISIIPLENIWEWVDEDVNERSWYLATFIPNELFIREGEICLPREVLIRYGENEDVRRNLRANFSTESYWGHRSAHLSSKTNNLLEFKKIETNENVRRWIDEYISILEKEIEQVRIEEERRGY